MAEAQSTSRQGTGREPKRVRTAGEGSPGAGPGRSRGAIKRRSAVARSAAGSTGSSARLLAPLALVICAIAVLAVLSSGGTDTPTRGDVKDTPSSEAGESSEQSANASDSSGDATGSTGPTRATYRVKPGDSFAAIAEKTGVDVDTLAELNPDVDPRALQPGQKLKLK